MLGDVVKLFLCRICKGLFVLDSQVEKHVKNCNGDAFKSPANLFACEREHFLEMFAPTASFVGTDGTTKVSKRKRRKTIEIDYHIAGGSYSGKDKSSTESAKNLHNNIHIDIPHVWKKQDEKSENISLCLQTEGGGIGNDQLQENVANLSKSQSDSEPFIVSFSGRTYLDPVLKGPQIEKDETYSTKHQDQTSSSSCFRNLTGLNGCREIIEKSTTPATNLLAYLSKLQQGEENGANEITGEQEQLLSKLNKNLSSISAVEKNEYFLINDQALIATTPNTTPFTVHNSALVEANAEARKQVHIIGGKFAEQEGFDFSDFHPVSDFLEARCISGEADSRDLCPGSVDSLHVYPEVLGSGTNVQNGKGNDVGLGVNASLDARNSENSGNLRFTSENDGLKIIFQRHECESSKLNCTDSAKTYQKDKSKANCSYEVAVRTESLLTVEGNKQESVVYIIQSDGQLTSVAVEDVINDDVKVDSMPALSNDLRSDGLLSQNERDRMVCETLSVVPDIIQSTTQLNSAVSETSQVILSSANDGNISAIDTVVPKGKSKNQIRLAELNALREEILKQATEIPPDADTKKICYRCNICGHVAKSVKFMHNHLQIHSDGKIYFECDQCDFKSRRRCKLIEHQQRHGRSRFLCHLCPATFMDMASLNRHVTSKHTDSQFLRCEEGEMFHCDVDGCEYKTPYLRALRVHQKRHTCEKNYQCSVCSYQAVEKCTLVRHMKSHTQDRPYQCSSCAFRANTKYGVLVHMQHIHQQQKNVYLCDKCPFRTTYASSIAKHLQTHMGNFMCPLCKHNSRTLSNIKKHLQQVHHLDSLKVVERKMKINVKDYLQTESNKPAMESLIREAMSVDSPELPPLVMTDMERPHIDPMKLSFHFHDLPQGPCMLNNCATNLTRSSSIPDLFTFSGMNRSSSQSDLFTFSGVSTMTRSNSMSDLVSFASSMCTDSVEPVNLDVSLSDATAPVIDVGGLSLGDGPVELNGNRRLDSPGNVVLALQCSKCISLLLNEEDVGTHNKTCTGTIQIV